MAGCVLSVQPRSRLTDSFDQRSHTYLGYALKVRGKVGSEARDFLVGVGRYDLALAAEVLGSIWGSFAQR